MEKLDEALDEAYRELGEPTGITAAVEGPCVKWAATRGHADRDDDEPLEDDHLVRIGSATKTYVSALLLRLQEEGDLDLDDEVGDYLDWFDAENITLRQLMQHTSGLFDYTSDDDLVDELLDDDNSWTPRKVVERALEEEAAFEPGDDWGYSNTNYLLLGLVAEAAGGASLAELLAETVFEPANLKATFLDGSGDVSGELAHGYDTSLLTVRDQTHAFPPETTWAAGGMLATPIEAASWARQLYGGSFLSKESRTELLEPADHSKAAGQERGYGLGVMLSTLADDIELMGHGGSIPGYITTLRYHEDTDVAIVAVITRTPRPSSTGAVDALVIGSAFETLDLALTEAAVDLPE